MSKDYLLHTIVRWSYRSWTIYYLENDVHPIQVVDPYFIVRGNGPQGFDALDIETSSLFVRKMMIKDGLKQ
jgi:hypothetical protein